MLITWPVIGVSCLSVLIGSLTALITHHGYNRHSTFSKHAAQSTLLSAYYGLVFIVTFIPMSVVWTFYLVPKYSLPTVYILLTWTAAISQVLCTFFPDNHPKNVLPHRILAGLSAACIGILTMSPLCITTLATLQAVPILATLVSLSVICVAIVKPNANHLLYQSVFYLCYSSVYLVLLLA